MEVYDYGRTADGTFFYVMEYLHGLTLDELVGRHGPAAAPSGHLPAAPGVRGAGGVTCGRLDPPRPEAGVTSSPPGAAGGTTSSSCSTSASSKPWPRGTRSGPSHEGTVCGTPQYMAPEQITGDRAVDRRCDLYAMGGVAYTLLTGRPPFEGETATQVMSAHVHDPVVPPSRHRPDIPPDLEKVVLRCLAKDPNGRFQSAEELETVLAACASAAEWDARKAASWWEEFEPPSAAPRAVG